jgi:hypothetical protein
MCGECVTVLFCDRTQLPLPAKFGAATPARCARVRISTNGRDRPPLANFSAIRRFVGQYSLLEVPS